MADIVSQILLPVTLAFIMLVMGLSLSRSDFVNLIQAPRETLLGLCLQLLLLPLLAIVIAFTFQLSAIASAGLLLLSLCPGGATSNAFSMFAKGNVALSISLTAITSLIVPFTIPLSFAAYLLLTGDANDDFDFPVGLMMKQLIVVTLIPVITGMLLRHFLIYQTERCLPMLKKLSGVLLISVIVLLFITNHQALSKGISSTGMAVIALCIMSMSIAFWLSRKANLSFASTKTITIEVGVQNAGTAMLIAFTVLNRPELAMTPLLYGLLMNIPAISFVLWVNRKRFNNRAADV